MRPTGALARVAVMFDHEPRCAALTGLPDVCTCGALYSFTAGGGSCMEGERVAAAESGASEDLRHSGRDPFLMFALLRAMLA